MNSSEYLELKERMDRIERKLDQFLGISNNAPDEPARLPGSFSQRYQAMIDSAARNEARKAERARTKAE